MLSEYGYDFLTGRSMPAIYAWNEIFEIIHPYVLPGDDLDRVQRTDPGIKALWLETFTNSLEGMLHNNININAKHEFAGNFFPPNFFPPYHPLILVRSFGLQFGKSILNRQVNDLAFILSIVSVHGAGGQRQTE